MSFVLLTTVLLLHVFLVFFVLMFSQVNGDIPPTVKKDAHAVILDFIRSRPPLKPVSHVVITN